MNVEGYLWYDYPVTCGFNLLAVEVLNYSLVQEGMLSANKQGYKRTILVWNLEINCIDEKEELLKSSIQIQFNGGYM